MIPSQPKHSSVLVRIQKVDTTNLQGEALEDAVAQYRREQLEHRVGDLFKQCTNSTDLMLRSSQRIPSIVLVGKFVHLSFYQ
mgnify:CR=1 FL=1